MPRDWAAHGRFQRPRATVPLSIPAANRRPSGATHDVTEVLCPLKTVIARPVSGSQSRTVPSWAPVATRPAVRSEHQAEDFVLLAAQDREPIPVAESQSLAE